MVENMVEKTYQVPDVHCEHCVRAINQNVGTIDGVENVDVDLDTKTVTVRHHQTVTEDQIIEGLDEAGFDVASS